MHQMFCNLRVLQECLERNSGLPDEATTDGARSMKSVRRVLKISEPDRSESIRAHVVRRQGEQMN